MFIAIQYGLAMTFIFFSVLCSEYPGEYSEWLFLVTLVGERHLLYDFHHPFATYADKFCTD